jgi:antirestriction protein ArdC
VPTVRHADYIASWIGVLCDDDRAIIRAASQASKAADYILGFLPENRQPNDNNEPSNEQSAA